MVSNPVSIRRSGIPPARAGTVGVGAPLRRVRRLVHIPCLIRWALHTTCDAGTPARPFLSVPSIASSNSAIAAGRGMMTSNACSEQPGEVGEFGE